MAQIQLQKIGPAILTPATPEAGEFLQRIKLGEWIHAEVKRVRNYQFHKRYFKLLQLGFDYWTPTGGVVSPNEQQLYKSALNVLWNWILFRKFNSPVEAENVAAQLLEFA